MTPVPMASDEQMNPRGLNVHAIEGVPGAAIGARECTSGSRSICASLSDGAGRATGMSQGFAGERCLSFGGAPHDYPNRHGV